jgi:hypothetical protein
MSKGRQKPTKVRQGAAEAPSTAYNSPAYQTLHWYITTSNVSVTTSASASSNITNLVYKKHRVCTAGFINIAIRWWNFR